MPDVLPQHQALIDMVITIKMPNRPPLELAGCRGDIETLMKILARFRELCPEESLDLFGKGYLTDIPTETEMVGSSGEVVKRYYDPCTFPSPTLMGVEMDEEE